MEREHRVARLADTFPDVPALTPLAVLGEGFGSVVVETGDGMVFRILGMPTGAATPMLF